MEEDDGDDGDDDDAVGAADFEVDRPRLFASTTAVPLIPPTASIPSKNGAAPIAGNGFRTTPAEFGAMRISPSMSRAPTPSCLLLVVLVLVSTGTCTLPPISDAA